MTRGRAQGARGAACTGGDVPTGTYPLGLHSGKLLGACSSLLGYISPQHSWKRKSAVKFHIAPTFCEWLNPLPSSSTKRVRTWKPGGESCWLAELNRWLARLLCGGCPHQAVVAHWCSLERATSVECDATKPRAGLCSQRGRRADALGGVRQIAWCSQYCMGWLQSINGWTSRKEQRDWKLVDAWKAGWWMHRAACGPHSSPRTHGAGPSTCAYLAGRAPSVEQRVEELVDLEAIRLA